MQISAHSAFTLWMPRSVPAPERMAAARLASLLSLDTTRGKGAIQLVNAEGQHLELPTALTEVMHRAAELLAQGRPVAVIPEEEMLTTQAAAYLLNVSRQCLVRLVDRGELAAVKVGSHRRLRASDVAAFKVERDARRTSALDRLAELSEGAGGYAMRTKQRD